MMRGRNEELLRLDCYTIRALLCQPSNLEMTFFISHTLRHLTSALALTDCCQTLQLFTRHYSHTLDRCVTKTSL